MSYGYNQALMFRNGQKMRMTRFRAPSKTVMLFKMSTDVIFDLNDVGEVESPSGCGLEGFVNNGKYATGFLSGVIPAVGTSGTSPFLTEQGRHAGQSNYLFIDGHVKAMRGAKVSPGFTAVNRMQPQSGSKAPHNAAGTAFPGFSATFSPV